MPGEAARLTSERPVGPTVGCVDSVGADAAAGTATDALVGLLLDGRYRIDTLIARGGMATVYAATDTRLDRPVAVKVMRPALAEDADFVERFAREARAAARLSSPEVVSVHDQGTDAATGTAYLVMEHVAGGTLRDLLQKSGPLSPARALEVLEPVVRALSAAHTAGLVHRDVKPENVLLGDDGRVKVTDFGLARAIASSNLTATTGFLMGTMAYLAPEQVQHGSSDPRTDVYAVGIVLWELLTGRPPFVSDSPMTIAYRHVHEDVPAPSTVAEGIPPAVDALVVHATRRDPSARPADAGELLSELRAARARLAPGGGEGERRRDATSPTLIVPRQVSRTPVPVEPLPRRRRLRPLLWVLILSVLAAAALAGGWYLGNGRFAATPAVLGMSQDAATQALRTAGLRVADEPEQRFSEDVAAGLVLAQTPAAGNEVRKGTAVTLVLSRGPDRRTLPNLVGMSTEQATAALAGVGLRLGPVTAQFSPRESGTVLFTAPPADQPLPPDTQVALVVSKGLEMLAVPGVQNKPRGVAEKTLSDAGFKTAVTEVFSENVPKGVVVEQAPAAGKAARGTTVTLRVSKGPELITIPNLIDRPRKEAEDALTALGLVPEVFGFGRAERVRTSDPGAGAQVRKGSKVALVVF